MPYREPEFLPWDGRRVPMTFIGGYLGAGKTTVINELLAHTDRRTAVIVNDVGAINIDARLIRKRHGDTIELTDGCICCSSIDGMGAALDQIRARLEPPDHLVVELSGVADPQRMLPWGRSAGFVLDALVVVVAGDQLIAQSLPEWLHDSISAQIIAADLLIMTKADLLDDASTQAALERVKALAPDTPVILRGGGSADSGAVGQFLALGGRRPGGPTAIPHATLFDAHETTVVVAPIGLSHTDLLAWLPTLSTQVAGQLVRVKGIVETTDRGLMLVQVVGSRCEVTALPEPERQPPTDLIAISLRG
jgi:G3E family GTPase